MRPSGAAFTHWNPSCSQSPLGEQERPREAAESRCAAVTLQPVSGPSSLEPWTSGNWQPGWRRLHAVTKFSPQHPSSELSLATQDKTATCGFTEMLQQQLYLVAGARLYQRLQSLQRCRFEQMHASPLKRIAVQTKTCSGELSVFFSSSGKNAGPESSTRHALNR